MNSFKVKGEVVNASMDHELGTVYVDIKSELNETVSFMSPDSDVSFDNYEVEIIKLSENETYLKVGNEILYPSKPSDKLKLVGFNRTKYNLYNIYFECNQNDKVMCTNFSDLMLRDEETRKFFKFNENYVIKITKLS